MADVFYGSGSIDFGNGRFTTEYVAYVLGNVVDPYPFDFPDGSGLFYDLSPKVFYGTGSPTDFTHGSALLVTDFFGAFEDFAVFPEGTPDPVNGIVLADNSGTLSAGVGTTWSRHYRVLYPPKNARYVVPHIRLGVVPAGSSQYLDAHQIEFLTAGSTAPSAFGSARSLRVHVRPTRLNYAAGSTHVTNLVAGLWYTASAYVNGKRVVATFKATASTVDLNFGGTASKILVEEGTVLGDYFDGWSGPDYLWEQGGTPGSSRSYYYPDRTSRHYVLVRTLQENAPLGVTVEDPQYAMLPAPSTAN